MPWTGSRNDELGRFDDLFTRAVERCVGAGPAGVYLSSGLDSVSVAAVAVDLSRRGQTATPCALSLLFPGTEIDETHLQQEIAVALGTSSIRPSLRGCSYTSTCHGPCGLADLGPDPVPRGPLLRAARATVPAAQDALHVRPLGARLASRVARLRVGQLPIS